MNTSVLTLECGTWRSSTIRKDDYAMVVIQTCLWSVSIHPVRVKVSFLEKDCNGTWDINASMKVPISMYTQYGADYDGDEMTIFVVTTPHVISECQRFE